MALAEQNGGSAAASVRGGLRGGLHGGLHGALPGLAVVVALGAAATGLGRLAPVVGAPVIAVLLGIAARFVFDPGAWAVKGLAVGSRTPLQLAIVLLGAGLGLGTVLRVGASSLPVMLGTLAVALALGRVVGRALHIEAPLRTLVTVGTGICGASAIAAVASVIEVESADLAYAISTIFVFNIAAVMLFPVIGHALGLGQQAFGLWAGTAVNDTSSVVAAGYAYGHAAGAHAVVVKLTRTTLIVPIVMALAAIEHRRRPPESGRRGPRWARLVPPFLLLFLVASAANSLGVVGKTAAHDLGQVAVFLIAVALAAVGLSTQPRRIAATGPRPLVLGAILWIAVASASLLLQAATGRL
jgi:uncharacterized integral membrane protein (TIGR00698 family)